MENNSKCNHYYKRLIKFLFIALIVFSGAGWLMFKFMFFVMQWPFQGISIWTQLWLGGITGFVAFAMISPLVLKFLESRRTRQTESPHG